MAKIVDPFNQYGFNDAVPLTPTYEQAEKRMKQIANDAVEEAGGIEGMADVFGTDGEGIDYLKQVISDNDKTTGILEEINKKADKDEIPSLDAYATTESVNEALSLKANKDEIPTDFYSQEDVNKLVSQLTTRIETIEKKESIVVADSAEMATDAPAGSDVVLTSTDAIDAMTSNKVFNTITLVGGNSNSDIKLAATDKVTVDGTTINGDKGASNCRMLIYSNDITIKNIDISSGTTAYNVFESSQDVNKSEYFVKKYNVSNIICDNTMLNHNILNIYTFENNAVINVSNSKFNLDVDKSNVLRLANICNATGVTVNFEDVEWTYENSEGSNWDFAGLVIYQPYATDHMISGDDTEFKTWKFNFKNCKYNGVKVDALNFGEHNQVMYLYDVNSSGSVTDPSAVEGLTVTFA